ncbi:MAG: heme-binding protein, partial [Thermodesulfobacteriota bacterium]
MFALSAFALPTRSELRTALKAAVAEENGGFGFDVWATIVDRDGVVKEIVFSGTARGDQRPGGRVMSAQKANTANAFSLTSLALSTANLYSAVQPGGSLFGLQFGNPVNPAVA